MASLLVVDGSAKNRTKHGSQLDIKITWCATESSLALKLERMAWNIYGLEPTMNVKLTVSGRSPYVGAAIDGDLL